MLLSIVIPVYNIRDYIKRNIESFQNVDDKLKDKFELLIINDGSTDDTLEVLDNLLINEKKLNIKIITKENGGHGSAVNRGVEEATGKYLKIVDGDDWVNTFEFNIYLERLEKTESDLIVTNYSEQHLYKNFVRNIKSFEGKDFFHSTEIVKIFPMHSITYKTDILVKNNIKLTERIFYVDTQFTIFPLKYVTCWEYWDLDVYQYFLGRPDQSMAMKNRLKNLKDHKIVAESIFEFYDKLNPDEFKDILCIFVKRLINSRFIFAFLSDDRDNLLKETYEYVNKYNIDYRFEKKQRISYLLYLNEKFNRNFSFIIYPLVRLKTNKLMRQGF